MTNTRKTWISVIIGIAIVLVLLGITVVGSAVYFFSRHVSSQVVARETAEQQFVRARERFSGRPPLIDVQDERRPIVHRPARDGKKTNLQSVRVLAYDRHERKLLNLDIPFWLVRLMPSLRVNEVEFDAERFQVTVDDLERFGPGLIVDGGDRNALFLVWTE